FAVLGASRRRILSWNYSLKEGRCSGPFRLLRGSDCDQCRLSLIHRQVYFSLSTRWQELTACKVSGSPHFFEKVLIAVAVEYQACLLTGFQQGRADSQKDRTLSSVGTAENQCVRAICDARNAIDTGRKSLAAHH